VLMFNDEPSLIIPIMFAALTLPPLTLIPC
jgi:hypothetical protein